MLKVCPYCGRIHRRGEICPRKPIRERRQENSKLSRFRNTNSWRRKAKAILDRDCHLCRACLAKLPGTIRQYNSERLSVHHIVPLSEDFERRLDDGNLITLCDSHHKQADSGKIKRAVLSEMAKTGIDWRR